MIYPQLQDYESHMRILDSIVYDDRIKGGTPLRSTSGNYIAFSGGYSVVYKINKVINDYALRCWIRNPGDVRNRYDKSISFLKSKSIPYFVGFDYIDRGIRINNIEYPISVMDWVDGEKLSQFLDENINSCFCQSKTRPVAREKRAHLGLIIKVLRVESAPI